MDKIEVENNEERDNLLIKKADLLRRSLQFERVIEEYKDFNSDDELLYSIIRFQLELAIKKDSGCYTVENVVKEYNIDV